MRRTRSAWLGFVALLLFTGGVTLTRGPYLQSLAYELGPRPLVAALALALLLVVVQCGAPVFAQATPARGATTLTWDVYEVEAENIDSYRLYYWPAGQTPGETFVTVPIDGVYRRLVWHWYRPVALCCFDPSDPPGCVCGYYEDLGWWPQAVSPVKLVVGAFAENTEVCFYLTARDSVGNRESGPSNTVCLVWPKVCEFTTRDELRACMGVVP